jgi:hypothetical protein
MLGKVTKVLVLHWFPLEQFPPAQNLLNVLGSESGVAVACCTTRKQQDYKLFTNDSIRIKRSVFPSRETNIFFRVLRFLLFPWLCLWTVLWNRPDVLIYYEPHSAPAAWLCLLLNPRCRLMIHYHEYREPKHFRDRGNSLARLGHWLEKYWLFRKARWISHTNHDRIRLFLKDCPEVPESKLHALPNMPPRHWIAKRENDTHKDPIILRLIYIGAISLHDTYLEPLLTWFKNIRKDNVSLDLFINNIDPATEKFLAKENEPGLTIHLGGVPYDQLPSILPKYDIGLILYRCNTINYVYNAPNKLFEYLMCGLNVIYPQQMLGVAPYARSECSPWVKSIDFEKLSELSVDELKRWGGAPKQWEQSCETVYKELLNTILTLNEQS